MKSNKSKLLIALTLFSLSSASLAFGPRWGDPEMERGPGYRLAQELNLSTEQQAKINEIIKAQRKEAQEWHKQHKEQGKEKISKLLTEEQQEKFKQLKEKRGYGPEMGARGPARFGPGMNRDRGGMGPCGNKKGYY